MPLHADGLAKLLPDPNGPEWAASNARRIELIGKDLHGGLTDVEQVEYEALEELADEIQSFLSPFREVDEEEERLLDERLRAEEEPIG